MIFDEKLYEIISCGEPNARNWLFKFDEMLTAEQYVKMMMKFRVASA